MCTQACTRPWQVTHVERDAHQGLYRSSISYGFKQTIFGDEMAKAISVLTDAASIMQFSNLRACAEPKQPHFDDVLRRMLASPPAPHANPKLPAETTNKKMAKYSVYARCVCASRSN
jgi:hypothetical protein